MIILTISSMYLPTTESTLNCDGFEYSYRLSEGITFSNVIGIGICGQHMCIGEPFEANGSNMYVCGTNSNIGNAYFTSNDCSGIPNYILSVDEIINESIYNIMEFQSRCSNPSTRCNYALIKYYNTATCNDSMSGVSVNSSVIDVITGCQGVRSATDSFSYSVTSCHNAIASYEFYESNSICNGTDTISLQDMDGDCNPLHGKIMSVSCRTAVDTHQTIYNIPTSNCDGLEYSGTDPDGNVFHAVSAAGVCTEDIKYGGYKMLVCGTDGNIGVAKFVTADCSGNPVSITSLDDWIEQRNEGYTINNIISTCCSGNYCDYGLLKIYNTATCNDSIVGVSTNYSDYYIIGACEGTESKGFYSAKSCANEFIIFDNYVDIDADDCSGAVSYTDYTYDCYSDGKIASVTCDTAIDTCLAKYNTETTITTTKSASEITKSTMIVSDVSTNIHSNAYQYGTMTALMIILSFI